MTNYRFPPLGQNDPIEDINHYVATRIGGALTIMREGGKPRIGIERDFFLELLTRYADGTYAYTHTASFNPEIALSLKSQVLAAFKPGATFKDLEDLAEKLLSTMDRHAVEAGRPNKTRKAMQEIIDSMKN